MKKQLMIALLSIAPALGVVAQDKLYKDEFPLGDITLLDGPLKHARDLNVQVLLKYDFVPLVANVLTRPSLGRVSKVSSRNSQPSPVTSAVSVTFRTGVVCRLPADPPTAW